MLLKIVCLLTCRVLGLAFRGDRAEDAGLLVLRHENAVLRRHAGRVRYEPGGRVRFASLARLLPRRRWAGIFPVTPATLLAWHRKLAGGKYDTSKRRKPGHPATAPRIARLVVRRARARGNPLWGRTAGSRASLRSPASLWHRPPGGRSCAPREPIRRLAGPAPRGGSSCLRRPPGSSRLISCT
ncbi:MAG: hypothetical protein M3Z75_24155 [Actinomycetota bacterium]|nr:hypothetical protein [Actinomycetota bacterium]